MQLQLFRANVGQRRLARKSVPQRLARTSCLMRISIGKARVVRWTVAALERARAASIGLLLPKQPSRTQAGQRERESGDTGRISIRE